MAGLQGRQRARIGERGPGFGGLGGPGFGGDEAGRDGGRRRGHDSGALFGDSVVQALQMKEAPVSGESKCTKEMNKCSKPETLGSGTRQRQLAGPFSL